MSTTVTFGYSGVLQSWAVPPGITSLDVTCRGADGDSFGGCGAQINLTGVPVTPGETLYISVGEAGAHQAGGGGPVTASGTFGGGGAGGDGGIGFITGGSGGGSSDIPRGGTALGNRVIVAGGGGGSCQTGPGGGSGGAGGSWGGGLITGVTSPLPGANGAIDSGSGVAGGYGGTGSAGGIAGGFSGDPGTDGFSGRGGDGSSSSTQNGSGGGGGGYFGGGGGGQDAGALSSCNGGGGGSSWWSVATTATSAVTDALASDGIGGGTGSSGFGFISFTYNYPPNPPTPTSPANNSYNDLASGVVTTWSFSDPNGDIQSAADIRFRAVGATSWTTITSAVTGPSNTYTITPGSLTNGVRYEWQVQGYDTSIAASGWSASRFFYAVSLPSMPAIVSPATNQVILSLPSVSLSWTPVAGQTDYELKRLNDVGGVVGSIEYEHVGPVVSAASSAHFLDTMVDISLFEHWQVRVRTYGTFWSDWANVRVRMNLNPPAMPTISVTAQTHTSKDAGFFITNNVVTVTLGLGGAAPNKLQLLRSYDGAVFKEIPGALISGAVPSVSVFEDYSAPLNIKTWYAASLTAAGPFIIGSSLLGGEDVLT